MIDFSTVKIKSFIQTTRSVAVLFHTAEVCHRSRLIHLICITICNELSGEQFVCLRTRLMDVHHNNLAPEEDSTLTSSVYYDTSINCYTIVILLCHVNRYTFLYRRFKFKDKQPPAQECRVVSFTWC